MTVTAFITAGKPSAVDELTCSPEFVLDIPARERNSSILKLRDSEALRLNGHIIPPQPIVTSGQNLLPLAVY